MTGKATIGIVTGSGPEAGIDLWSKILAANRTRLGPAYRGDVDAPRVRIISEPELGRSMDLARYGAEVRDLMLAVCAELAAEVDYYAIACNTLHCFAPDVSRLPRRGRLVGLPEAAAAVVERSGVRKVALLGASPVMDLAGGRSPYRELAGQFEIETPADHQAVDELILEIKREGANSDVCRRKLSAILGELRSDMVLLACTELPLVGAPDTEKLLIDVTQCLADLLVDLLHGPDNARSGADGALT
jgi:aspartate racemase